MIADLHDSRVSRHGDAATSAAFLTDALYYETAHRQLSRVLFYRSAMLGTNTEAEAARGEGLDIRMNGDNTGSMIVPVTAVQRGSQVG
ncbi:MAG: hypothetical protein JSS38_07315 [Nitrospira sp.]|nr:hypothetical protein [Nitrospira sp.]